MALVQIFNYVFFLKLYILNILVGFFLEQLDKKN